MTNYEKYRELVISCIMKESICDLADVAYGNVSCTSSHRTCEDCAKFTAEWLSRECVEIEWGKVPVDTPILIECEKGTMRRHFSGYWHGHVFVYANGKTSWTNDGETQAWEPEYVKFGRDEDFTKYAKQ